MRRAMIVITATVAGTAGVLGYQPALEREASALRDRDGAAARLPGQIDAAPVVGAAMIDPQDADPPKDDAAAVTPRAVRWSSGSLVSTPAGNVEVDVALADGAITDVRVVRLPDATRHSAWLSARAATVLRQEVLMAQSTEVDVISGATYTSEGYLKSLQAALDGA